MGQGMTWMLFAQFIYLLAFVIISVHGTIYVKSEETNETVKEIHEKNIRAVSDAVEDDHDVYLNFEIDKGYVVISNPLNACEPVDPAPIRKNSFSTGNASTEDSLYAFDDDGRIERDWVLLSIVYDCDVTTKARNAQLGGYKALIIQNIGSNDSQHIPWHILRFPLVKLNHVLVGEYDGDLLRFNFSYPNNRYYVKFEEDKFYQLMCYILIGIIIVLLSTMFALFWFQICCAIIIVVPHQIRQLLQRWLHPGKRRLTRPMLQLIPVKNWSSTDPFQACAICQEDFKENDKLRVLPCLHGFHAMCVDPWLLRRSRHCPSCRQGVRLPNDKNDDDENENEENFVSSQIVATYGRSSPDAEIPTTVGDRQCVESGIITAKAIDDPLLVELTEQSDLSPQTRFHSALSNPKSDTSQGSCTITSPSESRKSSQDGKSLDWQLRRFLQSFNYNPSDGVVCCQVATTPRQQGKKDVDHVRKHDKARSETDKTNPPSLTAKSTSITISNAENTEDAPTKLLETSLDASLSGSTDVPHSTLEVLVGTIVTEDGSYHLSSPYPATSNNTFTISTTRDRKTSDATTISGSLPRDESSFHIADEIHSEIISEEVFDEVSSAASTHSDQDDTAQADKD